MTQSGRKSDSGKPDLSLIPFSALKEEALGFMFGEKKYARDNYKLGFQSHRLIAAALRHIHAWEQGEDNDPESGVHHLGHARCCLAMLLECRRLETLTDTRHKAAPLLSCVPSTIEGTSYVSNITTGRLSDGTEITGHGSLDYLK